MMMTAIETMIQTTKTVAAAMLLVAAVAGSAAAQEPDDLNQEITVTHHEEVKPTDAVKLNVSPAVSMPAMVSQRLAYGTRRISVVVPASISTLGPAAYGDTIYSSSYRGYAAVGYLPAFDLGASAGYKFIDNDRVRLNGWMQYDGSSYRGDLPWRDDDRSVRLRRNVFTVGASLHSAVGRESFLDFGLDYTFARFNTPNNAEPLAADRADALAADFDLRNQNVHRLNAEGLWTMSTGKWNCGIGMAYSHFGYANAVVPYDFSSAAALKPVRENRFTARAFASASAWGAEATGMEVRLSYVTNGHRARLGYADPADPYETFMPGGSFNHALLSLRPYYRTTWKKIVLDLGVNLDFTFNNGKAFHISPAAQATWKPSPFVSFYINARGGEQQNSLGSLFDVTRYGLPNMAYGNSHVMLDGEVGVTVGQWRGFYSEISAAYAIANDWLMPEMIGSTFSVFEPIDMKGWKLHFGAGYRYRRLLDVSASIEVAPHKYDRGYYLWRDRARYVAEACLRVTPIEPLDIELKWNYRSGRRVVADNRRMPEFDYTVRSVRSLGVVNAISLGGNYRLTSQWTIFANIENLTGHRYTMLGGLPSQGIGGLVGATYKF